MHPRDRFLPAIQNATFQTTCDAFNISVLYLDIFLALSHGSKNKTMKKSFELHLSNSFCNILSKIFFFDGKSTPWTETDSSY